MDRKQIGCLICIVILLSWISVTLADTVPEEARRYMARGMAAVEMAKTPNDYKRAVREFEQAAKLAPNWPDVYFNLGSVQAKAGNYGEAMRYYKRYLELAPAAPDAAKVREEIYKLEYRAEAKETELAFLEGDWTCTFEYSQAKYKYKKHFTVRGHQVEVTTSNCFTKPSANLSNKTTSVYAAEIIEDILVLSVISSSVPGYVGQIEKYKLLSNTDFRNTDWQCHKDKNNPLPGSASVPSLPTGAYKGVRDYENGDKYEGEFTNRKPHGKGTFTFANGNKYEGDVVDGKPHGKGTYTCGNGKQFTGNFENNKPIGFTIICN